MAISIDPLTYVVTIPKTDLTLISGTLYSYDTNAFRLELKGWEDDIEGMPHTITHIHNTEVTIAGIAYAKRKPRDGFTKYERPKRILKIWLNGKQQTHSKN